MIVRYAVIMAGGSGTRLWPLSRLGEPKQLLTIFDHTSLLQQAWARVNAAVDAERIIVCTSASYADTVRSQLPDLREENLLGEPVGRDSLNAIAWSLATIARRDPEAVVAVVTADQIIEPVEQFVFSLEEGYRLAEQDSNALVCFGIIPDSAHTGYGYLERGDDIDGYHNASSIKRFHEKPTQEKAEEYLASGQFWWNAGMFVWKASTFLDQMRQLMPDDYHLIEKIVDDPSLCSQIFPTLTKISVDYAIMEPVSHGRTSAHLCAVGLAVTWKDVGSLTSLCEIYDRDDNGNALSGQAVAEQCSSSLIINTTPHQMVACHSLNNTAVICTDQIVMVIDLDQAQQVKGLVSSVIDRYGSQWG